jgi:hypothetical protein
MRANGDAKGVDPMIRYEPQGSFLSVTLSLALIRADRVAIRSRSRGVFATLAEQRPCHRVGTAVCGTSAAITGAPAAISRSSAARSLIAARSASISRGTR